ncbi:porin [Burkholderia sp. SR8]|uniref:porin n=1 Tax=Burkholderia sp. SR8 TaxID=3062277 RepID=UPI004064C38E
MFNNSATKAGWMVGAMTVLCSPVSYAQSSVTLYGIIDTGVTYVSNQQVASPAGGVSGKGAWSMSTGNLSPTSLGLRGSEDLGGGASVVFNLQSYFPSNNGALFQANNLFDATAMVGLKSDAWGMLTAGRQFDSYTNALAPFAISNTWAGAAGAHFGDIDNVNGAFSLNNGVQYTSPTFHGLNVSGTFGFGNHAGAFSTDRAWAAAVNYTNGPFSLGAGYLSLRNPLTAALGGSSGYIGELSCGQPAANYCGLQDASEVRTFGLGAGYTMGALALNAMLTRSILVDSRYLASSGGPVSDVRFDTAELGGLYNVTSAFQLGLGYSYTQAKIRALDSKTNIHKLSVGAIYSLSKRTQLYVLGSLEKMTGAGLGINPETGAFENYAQIGYQLGSNTSSQIAASVGIKHSF